jgi:hypothetical protein
MAIELLKFSSFEGLKHGLEAKMIPNSSNSGA